MAFKTKVSFERPFTKDESIERQSLLVAAVANGTSDGTFERDEDFVIRTWSTLESAQAWLDYCATVVPGPVSAELIVE